MHILSKICLDTPGFWETLQFCANSPLHFWKLAFHQVLVYSNKDYAIVTISTNNFVFWQKLKTSEMKKSPKFVENRAYEQLLGNLIYFSFNFTKFLISLLR